MKSSMNPHTAPAVDRWVDEQMFEEDVRAVMSMMRPHRRERLLGWSEYRTGAKHFRATVSWDEEFAADAGSEVDPQLLDEVFVVPNFADVLESLNVGSVRSDAHHTTDQECETYRAQRGELSRRVETRSRCSAM
jgi:hypothetical protein